MSRDHGQSFRLAPASWRSSHAGLRDGNAQSSLTESAVCGEPAASELCASASSDRICSCMRSGQTNKAFSGRGKFCLAQDAEAALNSIRMVAPEPALHSHMLFTWMVDLHA